MLLFPMGKCDPRTGIMLSFTSLASPSAPPERRDSPDRVTPPELEMDASPFDSKT